MSINFTFFGSSDFSVYVLEALSVRGFSPQTIVTFPDKPAGRKLIPTANPIKKWALEHRTTLLETEKIRNDGAAIEKLKHWNSDLFVVASFGQILPDEIIYMPEHKTLNVHPSLLPKLRGPAPIQGAILGESETGVTIMRLDSKMDEGPIVAKTRVEFDAWPIGYREAEAKLGKAGGDLLASVLPGWIEGTVAEVPQDRSLATYTHLIQKKDADITNDDPNTALRKILAYEVWPRARLGDLIVTKAHLDEGMLVIDRVTPPGKGDMPYADYLRGKNR